MAVQPQTPYKEYIANGVTTVFPLDFDCKDKDHLIVMIDDAETDNSTWSLNDDHVIFNVAPAVDKKITLQRNTPYRRDRNYQAYDNSFRPDPVNKDFDWIWWKLQELGVADWILGNRINALKNYVDRKDDELKAYLMEEIRKQGVALDQLDEYYNYLMERLAQIAVDKGWDASFVVDASGETQQQINNKTTKFVSTISDLLGINNPKDGDVVIAKGYRTPTNFALKTPFKGGGEFIYVAEKASENDGFIVYNGWVRQNVTTIKPEYNGAYGDGVTDDWEYLQKSSIYSILNKRELELDATTYFASKPWYVNAIDFSRCQATATGKDVLAAHQMQYLKIRGQGFKNTTIRGTGKHVVQVGNFVDDNYGVGAIASWYADLSDFEAVGDGVNTQYAIIGSFINHFHFENINAQGGTKSAWYIKRATWTPSLWCTFSNCRGRDGEVTAKFECNSFSFEKRCFFGYGTQLCFEIIGSRNTVYGLSSEITAKSPLTPSFARVEGSCEFFSPDFECGVDTNGRHAFIVAENSNLTVTMPTLIGIKDVLVKAENDNTTARWMVTPLQTQGRTDNDTLNNWQIHSNKPLSVQALPKWKYKRHEVKTIALTNTAAAWSANTTIMLAPATLNNNSYLNALLPHVIRVQNTGTAQVEVRIGLVDGGGTVAQVGSKIIPASSTVNLDDRELNYGISMYTGTHIRAVYISYRYTGSDGDLTVTPVSLEAQSVF